MVSSAPAADLLAAGLALPWLPAAVPVLPWQAVLSRPATAQMTTAGRHRRCRDKVRLPLTLGLPLLVWRLPPRLAPDCHGQVLTDPLAARMACCHLVQPICPRGLSPAKYPKRGQGG
jgi:hypothetical protein